MSTVEWREWNEVTFETARREDKPIFLFITTSWCPWCKAMERDVLSIPEVAEGIRQHLVAVRADADRRPDINARYNMGGWPSLAFLTPDGDIITGSTFLEGPKLAELIEKISHTFRTDKSRIEEIVREITLKGEKKRLEHPQDIERLSLDILKNVSRSIIREFDEKYGGFGTGQKFPHAEALDFAILQHFKTNDLKLYGVVTKTLDGMAEGGIFDRVGGGFFRFCATRDWRAPHTEKLLETNVRLLNNYLDAYRVMQRDPYREVAVKTVDYITNHLWDRDLKAFRGSQDSDDDYYQLEVVERRDRKPPQVDRTLYANLNAQAAGVFLKAAVVLDAPQARDMAVSALEFILENLYSPERGVYHYFDQSPHILGLLSDQIYLCQALLAAVEYTGINRYLDVIRDLIETIILKQSSTHGGFYDIPCRESARGGLTRQNKSILENAVMASVLIRYHYLTWEERYLKLAESTLSAFAQDYHLYGYFTAGYAQAVDLYFFKPLYVIILGSADSEKTRALRRAATQIYLPSRVVQTIDPDTEPELVKRVAFPIGHDPKAYVCLEQACHAAVDDPDELKNVMTVIDKNRAPGP